MKNLAISLLISVIVISLIIIIL